MIFPVSSLRPWVPTLLHLASLTAAAVINPKEQDPSHWIALGQEELSLALNSQPINKRAKNIILFTGDGMSLATVTSARIFQGQSLGRTGEEGLLFFEKFPYMGHVKTYSVDTQTPDSAATATAFLSGVKTRYGVLGVDGGVTPRDCPSQQGRGLTTILNWSQDAGKDVGVITNMRVTHATAAAAYAKAASRDWECDDDLKDGATYSRGGQDDTDPSVTACKDIARQLVEDNPDIKVILGGGRRNFLPVSEVDPETKQTGNLRRDGRNLVQEWLEDKRRRNFTPKYVWNAQDFNKVDVNETDYLLGLFAASHMEYEYWRSADTDGHEAGEPSLAQMTAKAIGLLQRADRGFFLFVENGLIDYAHHANKAKLALTEMESIDQAVRTAAEMTSSDDTLIIVTSDHSQVLVFGGTSSRGNSITGVEDSQFARDGHSFTTLLYGNGPGFQYGRDTAGTRKPMTSTEAEDIDYRQQSAVPLDFSTHSGEDVMVYAQGPMAHLVTATHEQTYLAYVMAYASCVGRYANEKDCAAALEPVSTNHVGRENPQEPRGGPGVSRCSNQAPSTKLPLPVLIVCCIFVIYL